jgi:hypothetical protein
LKFEIAFFFFFSLNCKLLFEYYCCNCTLVHGGTFEIRIVFSNLEFAFSF